MRSRKVGRVEHAWGAGNARITRSLILPYLIAILAVLTAVLTRYELTAFWGRRLPFMLFFPAVAFAEWFGGLGPGLVAIALSTACVLAFFPPAGSLLVHDPGHIVEVTVFILVNLIIASLSEGLHRTRRRAKLTELALRKSEERLRAILTSATDAIISIDAGQKITLFNRGAEAVFGYSSEEMIGRKLDGLLPEHFRNTHRDHVDSFGRTDAGMRAMGRQPVLTGLRKNGEEFPLEAHISQVEVAGEKIYTVILRDITAREELHRTLELSNRRKDEFLAMLGHELRNPLAAIQNAVALLSLDESARGRALDIAQRQTNQLGRLVDDLLDVARITQGQITLQTEPVALGKVIELALESTATLMKSRSLHVAVSLPPGPVRIEADPVRLEQVFVNLLSNAAQYTEAGGRINLVVERCGEEASVYVRDSGIGIAPEMLPRIWELFAQAARTPDRKEGGLGIGLTVAQRLVQLHDGRIEAYSEGLGKGAQFIVTLPISPTLRADSSSGAAPEVLPQVMRRILVVEDNLDAAESLQMLLELLGHQVRTVPDGMAALEAVHVAVPDIILLDIGLPGMDGYELARRLRQQLASARVMLVAFTGYGSDEDKLRALAAGFDHHLVKPVDIPPSCVGSCCWDEKIGRLRSSIEIYRQHTPLMD